MERNKAETNNETVTKASVTGDKSREVNWASGVRTPGGEKELCMAKMSRRRSESEAWETGSLLRNESAFPATINLSARADYPSQNTGVWHVHGTEDYIWGIEEKRQNACSEKPRAFTSCIQTFGETSRSAPLPPCMRKITFKWGEKWGNDTDRWQQWRGWATNVSLCP